MEDNLPGHLERSRRNKSQDHCGGGPRCMAGKDFQRETMEGRRKLVHLKYMAKERMFKADMAIKTMMPELSD